LRNAHKTGVEILCYDVRMDFKGIRIHRALPIFL
jgi:DNA-binding sugar fermentation-stimulating protein